MSGKSDAMRIVMELIEDTIGRIVLRDAMKAKKIVEEQEVAKKDDMIEVDKAENDKAEDDKTENDWVTMIDAEESNVMKVDTVENGKSKSDKVKFLNAKENDVMKVDKAESGKEQIDEVKFIPYDKLNFNWTKVQVLYQGQSK